MPSSIFLIGARASGKTTIGRALAEALKYNFVDTDMYLQEIMHMTVADVVAREGWIGFRRRESEALMAVTMPGTVIATGGGMVLSAANRAFMRANGTVLYLNVPADVMAARLAVDPHTAQRPTLTGRSIIEEVADVLESREPLYRETAHHVLDASAPVGAVLHQALRFLNS